MSVQRIEPAARGDRHRRRSGWCAPRQGHGLAGLDGPGQGRPRACWPWKASRAKTPRRRRRAPSQSGRTNGHRDDAVPPGGSGTDAYRGERPHVVAVVGDGPSLVAPITRNTARPSSWMYGCRRPHRRGAPCGPRSRSGPRSGPRSWCSPSTSPGLVRRRPAGRPPWARSATCSRTGCRGRRLPRLGCARVADGRDRARPRGGRRSCWSDAGRRPDPQPDPA